MGAPYAPLFVQVHTWDRFADLADTHFAGFPTGQLGIAQLPVRCVFVSPLNIIFVLKARSFYDRSVQFIPIIQFVSLTTMIGSDGQSSGRSVRRPQVID